MDGNTVYVATTEAVVALEPRNGARRWRNESDGEPSDPVVDDGRAYVATEEGVVHAIDRRTRRGGGATRPSTAALPHSPSCTD